MNAFLLILSRIPALGTVPLTFSVNLPPQLILEVSS